jgi:hypothetical protein
LARIRGNTTHTDTAKEGTMTRLYHKFTTLTILFAAAFVLAACAAVTPRAKLSDESQTADVYKKAIYKQSRWPFGLN